MRYIVGLLVCLLMFGVSSAMGATSLSDDEMDQVVAQGKSKDPTSWHWQYPNRFPNANQLVVQICAYAICAGPVADVSQTTNNVVSLTPNNVIVHTPWSPSFDVSPVSVPTVQVPSVSFQNTVQNNPTNSFNPVVKINNSFIRFP